jgi:hypothetical protein
MEAYKKAALHIHSLNDSDRRWLLGNLPDHQVERLQPMLEELRSLGIPRSQDLVQAADDFGSPAPDADPEPEQAAKEPPEFVGRILPAAPERLHRALMDEAPAVTAAVLLACDWPWHHAVLDAFDAAQRQTISEAMEQMKGKVTEKASHALVRVLAQKLRHLPENPGADDDAVAETGRPARRWSIFRRRLWQR